MTFREILEEKRVDLIDRIKAVRESVSELTNELAIKEAQLQNIEELIRLESQPTDALRASASDGLAARAAPLMDAVAVLLRNTGRPMHYQAIAQRLVSDGLHIPGKNPPANLLTQITRDARFHKTARGTYALLRSTGKK
jgi:HB1, ASXL, restriction endonuclease HTH domain